MLPGAWTNVMITISPYVIAAIVGTLFVLGFKSEDKDK